MSGIYYNGGSGGSSSNVQTLTGNTGGAVGPTANNINIIGTGGASVAGNPGSSTLTISVSGSGMSWNEVTGTSASMAINSGYVANNAGLVTLTLPATAAFGSVIQVSGKGSGGWLIAQPAGVSINFGASVTTTGVTGSLASTLRYDTVELLCVTQDTQWVAQSSVGNLTVS